MHGKAERGFQQFVPAQPGAEAQVQPRHLPRELPGQLDAAPPHEEVDDGQVVRLAPGFHQGLGPGVRHPDVVPLAPQELGQGLPARDVALDEKDRPPHLHAFRESNPRTTRNLLIRWDFLG